MTSGRDFTRAVRERMQRTGERYTTARAHLLNDSTPDDGQHSVFDSVRSIGGRQPDVAPARNLLADAGVTLPDGKAPDEAIVFGLAGGVGFLYGVFEYGSGPTMTIVARNDPLPDPFLEGAFASAGVTAAIETTSGAATARKRLDGHLTAGRSALYTVASPSSRSTPPTTGTPRCALRSEPEERATKRRRCPSSPPTSGPPVSSSGTAC